VFAAGIMAVIHLEHVQRGSEGVELGFGGADAGLLATSGDPGQDNGGEDGENGKHEQQFNERERAAAMIRLSGGELAFHNISDPFLFDVVLQGEYREDHPDENRADEGGDEKQKHRFGERNSGLELAVQVALGDGRDANQLLVEAAAFFGYRDHFERRTGEERAAFAETLSKLAALLDPLDRVGNRVHEDLVADGFAGDIKALDQRDSSAEQRAEHAAEAGHGELRNQRANQRSAKHDTFPDATALFRNDPGAQRETTDDQPHEHPEAVMNHKMAGGDDDPREQWEMSAGERVEHFLKARDEEHHQKHEHTQCEEEQDQRIKHRAHHFGAEFLFPRLEIGDLREHKVQESAGFACFNHGHVDAGKNVREPGHRFRERHAVDYGVVDFLPFRAGGGAGGFAVENDQRSAERNTGGKQAGKEAREIFEILGANLVRLEAKGRLGLSRRRVGRGRGSGGFRGLFRESYGPE